jgi:hypothetical protein
MGYKARVRFLADARDFSLFYSIQTSPGVHPGTYTMGIGALSPGVKRLRREANHAPPSSAKVKNAGAVSPLPHMSSWRGA